MPKASELWGSQQGGNNQPQVDNNSQRITDLEELVDDDEGVTIELIQTLPPLP